MLYKWLCSQVLCSLWEGPWHRTLLPLTSTLIIKENINRALNKAGEEWVKGFSRSLGKCGQVSHTRTCTHARLAAPGAAAAGLHLLKLQESVFGLGALVGGKRKGGWGGIPRRQLCSWLVSMNGVGAQNMERKGVRVEGQGDFAQPRIALWKSQVGLLSWAKTTARGACLPLLLGKVWQQLSNNPTMTQVWNFLSSPAFGKQLRCEFPP